MTGCNGYNGSVEGTVTFKGSGTPVKGAAVGITESYGANQDAEIARGTTDDNGYYSIYYKHRIYKTYHQFISVTADSLSLKREIEEKRSRLDISL